MSPHFFSRSARGPPCRWWLNKDVFFIFYLNSIPGELGIDPIWLADVTSDGLKVETYHVGQVVGKSGKAPHKQKALCKPQSETGGIWGGEGVGMFFEGFFGWNTCCFGGCPPRVIQHGVLYSKNLTFLTWKDFSKTHTNRSFTWSSEEF